MHQFYFPIPKLVLISSILFLTACGGGGGSSDSGAIDEGNSLTDYTDLTIYPITDTVSFTFHSTNDLFKLSDGSAWQIAGTSNAGVNTGRTISNVTILLSSSGTPDPVGGSRTDFYLIGDGITPAFYITPVSMGIEASDTIQFTFHSTGDLFSSSDDTAWQITGTSDRSVNTGRVTSQVTFYNSTDAAPDPVEGNRSDFYLIGNGINPAFFLSPIPMTIERTGTVVFSFHSVGDVFTVSDGSAWQITGTSDRSVTTGNITSDVTIYNASPDTPDPADGTRSSFYLIGKGINPAFFITRI